MPSQILLFICLLCAAGTNKKLTAPFLCTISLCLCQSITGGYKKDTTWFCDILITNPKRCQKFQLFCVVEKAHCVRVYRLEGAYQGEKGPNPAPQRTRECALTRRASVMPFPKNSPARCLTQPGQ